MLYVFGKFIVSHYPFANIHSLCTELELTQLFMQRQHQVSDFHFGNYGWQPVVAGYGDHLSRFTTVELFPWGFVLQLYIIAVASKEVLLEGSGKNNLCSIVNLHVGMCLLDLSLVLIEDAFPSRSVIHSLYCSHAAFLLLVVGVPAYTLAGFGVAFYPGEAV